MLKLLCVLDEHRREDLAIEIGRWVRLQYVILTLSRPLELDGKPQYPRTDNSAEFTAGAVMRWLRDQNVGHAFIAPGRPWQNGYVDSFHGKLCDECLNREWFHDAREARVIIERWRHFYNRQRPRSALGYRTPAHARQAGPGVANIDVRLTAWVVIKSNRRSRPRAMNPERRSVVLTGASGFIGSKVVRELWARGHAVAILKRVTSDLGRISHLLADTDNVTAYDLESTSIRRIFERHRPDVVIHMATVYGRQGESLSDVLASNVAFPVALLEAAILAETDLFLSAGSFSSRGDLLPDGLESYVLSKRQFRQCGSLLAAKSGIRLVNAQIEHPYGPGDGTGKFVPTVLEALLANKPEIPLTPGNQRRDFIFVDDVADAFVALAEGGRRLPAGVTDVEIGTGVSMALRKFVELAKDIAGSSTSLRFGALPYRSNEVMHSVADLSGMRLVGWSPKVSVEDGLRRTIESSRR